MIINNNFSKTGIKLLSNIIPHELIKKIHRRDLIIPLYHVVSDMRVGHIENIYPVKSTRDFERDLDFFLKFYNSISFHDFYNSVINKRKFSKPSFLLTFDDGLTEFKEVIAPILLRKGIPAICFLSSDFLDNKDLFYRHKASLLINRTNELKENHAEIIKWKIENFGSKNADLREMILSVNYLNKHTLDELAVIIGYDFNNYLSTNRPYLYSDEVESLQKKGFHFGAHSIDHPRYSLIDFKEQLKQTEDSISLVRKRFNINEKLFAFPFSDRGVNETFFEKIYKDGVTDVTFGTSGFDKSRLCFNHQQRISFDENFSANETLCIHSIYQFIRSIYNPKKSNK